MRVENAVVVAVIRTARLGTTDRDSSLRVVPVVGVSSRFVLRYLVYEPSNEPGDDRP